MVSLLSACRIWYAFVILIVKLHGKKLRLGEKYPVGISFIIQLASLKKKKIEKKIRTNTYMQTNYRCRYRKTEKNKSNYNFFLNNAQKTKSSSQGLVILCKAIYIKKFKKYIYILHFQPSFSA